MTARIASRGEKANQRRAQGHGCRWELGSHLNVADQLPVRALEAVGAALNDGPEGALPPRRRRRGRRHPRRRVVISPDDRGRAGTAVAAGAGAAGGGGRRRLVPIV